ncbi:MAG: hypothetical protein KY455_08765 [Euryarchaeota archaeon]|nr:hypothetical protein [Euryarchaeota archaeon]
MIARLEFKNIEARRFAKVFEKTPQGQVRIDHNSTVTLMTETSSSEAYIEFAYTTSYGAIGVIKVDGALVYHGENAGELVSQWRETKKMPNPIASEIHTTVMHACVPEAVNLAKVLRLPPPIPLPQVKFQQQKGGQAAEVHTGPEFQ